MIEIETPEVVVTTVNTDITVEAPSIETEVMNLDDLNITVSKKEYTIVGDDVYIPVLYDDAPQWMKDLVQIVVDVSVDTGNTVILAELTSILSEFAVSYVPLNQYTQAILDLSNENTSIHGVLTTLNSNFNTGLSNANAQIIDLALTKASKDEVVAQVVQTIAAQLADGTSNIGAIVSRIDQAIADETSARALSFDTLTASLEDTELGVVANAEATTLLSSYVGLDSNGGLTGTGLLADVEILQRQNDGVIETVTGTYDVMLNEGSETTAELVVGAEPYATWKAADVTGVATRTAHIGDVYIKYTVSANGAKEYSGSYKFIRTVVDSTSPYATDTDGFTWARVIDTLAESAYIAALNARDLADGKRRVFVGLGATTTPTIPYEIGDLWLIDAVRTVNGYTAKVGDMLRCIEDKVSDVALYEANDWVLASSYANAIQAEATALENWKNTTYTSTITALQTQVDKKAETFYQNSVPSGRLTLTNVTTDATLDGYVGDLWKNTYVGTIGGYLGNNTEYTYTKTANGANWDYKWTKMEVPDIVFDTIDTKKTIFVGNTLPVNPEINDMWITGDAPVGGRISQTIYTWNGTLWVIPVRYTDDTSVTALQNGLANGTAIINLESATIDGTTALTTYVAAEIDKEVVVYSGTNHSLQTGMKLNDIYIEKTTAAGTSGALVDVVNTWKYNGTSWVQIGNNNNLTKLADKTDGKRTIYSGSSLPVGTTANPLVVNDLFIPSTTFTVSTITYVINEMYRYSGSLWVKSTRYDEIKTSLESQILDNKIETFYQSIPPTSMTSSNTGDYWYCTDNYIGNGTVQNPQYSKGLIYKYNHTNTSWTFSADISKGAFDLADGKRTIFGNAYNDVPVAQVNDIWIPSSTGGSYSSAKVYKYNGAIWVEVDYTNDDVVNSIVDGTTPLDPNVITIGSPSTSLTDYVIAEVDKKIAVYSGSGITGAPVAGQPSGVAVNDIYLWFTTQTASGKTYDITRTYKYSGTAWFEITTNDDITNLADLADGKRTIFSGSVVPTGAVERDVWIPSANNGGYVKGEIYQYIGGVWNPTTRYTADIQALSNNVQTQIDGKVDTYYQDTVPFANATNVTRKPQAGDYWYCTLTAGGYIKGKMYKYVESANGSNWNYVWTETADITKYAFDLADGKASIFTTSAQPSSYKINDMMIVTTASFSNGTITFNNGVVLTSSTNRTAGFVASDWSKKINDTEDLDAFVSVIEPKVTRLKDQVDGKYQSWFTLSTVDPRTAAGYWAKYSTNVVPTGAVTGDVWWTTGAVSSYLANKYYVKQSNGTWLDSTTGIRLEHDSDMWYQTNTKLSYRYGSDLNAWELIGDSSVIAALAAAAAAQATADEVVVSFYAIKQDTAPATTSMWIKKTGNKVLQRYTTSWEDVDVKVGDTLTAYDPVTKDISTYVYNGSGWITNTENGLVAESKSVTDLTASLSTTNSVVSGHTTELSTVNARISVAKTEVESKWMYGSNLVIGGVSYTTGFGLNSTFTGTPNPSNPPVGTSEFWINADQFKLTTTGYTGTKYNPFTVNGTTGEITFNGKVSFSNTTDVPDYATSDELVASATAKVIYMTAVPTTGMVYGDYWLDTDSSGYLVYRYQGTNAANVAPLTWVSVNTATSKAIQNAYAAQKTADSKTKTYLQTTVPTGTLVIGDIWIDTDDNYKQYRWGGTAWSSIEYNPATAVNSGTTTINGGKITTGSITATQIAADSISADRLKSTTGDSTVWEGGGLVSANFNGNVNGSIGTPTAGFRLSSNAAGTSTDPTIYGAYIVGGTIEAVNFKGVSLDIGNINVKSVSNPSKTGRISYSTSTGNLVGSNYGSGFLSNRVCSPESSIVVQGFFPVRISDDGAYDNDSASATFIMQYSINSGSSWVTIDTATYTLSNAGALGNVDGLGVTIPLSAILTGSVVPTTGFIQFRCIKETSVNANVTTSTPSFLISLYNQ